MIYNQIIYYSRFLTLNFNSGLIYFFIKNFNFNYNLFFIKPYFIPSSLQYV